jgi:hypothetical protein
MPPDPPDSFKLTHHLNSRIRSRRRKLAAGVRRAPWRRDAHLGATVRSR